MVMGMKPALPGAEAHMEVQNGFIVGIFNYCDRWCERCPLTGRCRLFATLAEIDFEEGNGPLTEPRFVRERRRLFAQVIDMHAEAAELGDRALPKPGERVGRLPADMEASLGPDPEVVANGADLHKRMQRLAWSANPAVRLASETIRYFSIFVPMKMMRAFSQVARSGPGDQQSDANGSGKAALLGLERMERAWKTLIETRHFPAEAAAPFLGEIARMQRNLNRALPDVRAFVRPGFDEPDEVKMLDANEC
jgi:hypothetical protein